ncbi:MAG TPA: hypothetical protein VGM08_03575 [Candidatus Saccharimonadales bacterium]|jgi:hypothetical protein
MSRKPLLIIALIWLLLIAVPLGLTISHSLQGFHINQEYPAPSSFAAVIPFGQSSVVFSDGQELETYDYTTGQTASISQAVGLAVIDTVSTSSGRYITFHDSQVLQTGSLAGQLHAQGLGTTSGSWWLFDAQNRTFQPLPQAVLMAKLYNNQLYTLDYGNGGESISAYQLPGLEKISTLAIQGSSNFWPTTHGFLLQTANNQVVFTNNGSVNHVLSSSGAVVGVTADGQSAVVVSTQNNTRSLVTMNLQTNQTATITDNVANLPVLLDTGSVLYANTKGAIFSYSLGTRKFTQWKLGGALGKSAQNLKLVSLVSPSAAIVSNGSNYYLVGKGLAQTPPVQ